MKEEARESNSCVQVRFGANYGGSIPKPFSPKPFWLQLIFMSTSLQEETKLVRVRLCDAMSH